MQIYEELVARGLIAQVTNEEEIKEMINAGKATFYIGFDCTADSLTAGHFMALTLMKRLQMAGNKPIALIGGGTTMIGDPSGRTDMRKMLTIEDIQHNADCFKRQMEKFIDFGDGKAMMINNADWLLSLNYVDLLREVGACFSVNRMLSAECYKQRMERGLSFLEFNYMIMQSYDFYQYWRNVADADVLKCIRMLTFLPIEEIQAMDGWEGAQLNRAKEILAYELTALVHGEEEAKRAEEAARALYSAGDSTLAPTVEVPQDQLRDGAIDVISLLVLGKMVPSRSEGRRAIEQGGVMLNGEKVSDVKATVSEEDLKNGVLVKRGKKSFNKFVLA